MILFPSRVIKLGLPESPPILGVFQSFELQKIVDYRRLHPIIMLYYPSQIST